MSDVNSNGIVDEKEEKILNYVKSLTAIEEAMEPFKEQKRSLKQNYIENGWMSREEISLAVKALRLIKDNTDLEQLMDFYATVGKSIK